MGNNLKKFISNNQLELLIVVLICLFGLFLRMINLDKSSGMWLDEMNTYNISRQAFPFGIIKAMTGCEPHMPLFYIILHFWMKVFGESDYAIRLLSVLFGVLMLPFTYLAGKELQGKATGMVAVLLVSINSLLIYFSQEVRMYSLLPFLAVLSIYLLLKIKNNPTRLNYFYLILVNLTLLYSYLIACIFVFIQAFVMSVYLYLKDKKNLKKYITAQFITLLLFSPVIPFLFYQSASWLHFVTIWRPFSFWQVSFLLHDWFSPVMVLLFNLTPANFYSILFKFHTAYLYPTLSLDKFVIFGIIPVIIYIIGIFMSIKKKNFAPVLLLISSFFILFEIISAINGKMAFGSRYTIIVLPLVVLVASYGLTSIRNLPLKGVLITSLVLINTYYLIANPYSTPKLPRDPGYNSIVKVLDSFKFAKGDMVMATAYTNGYINSSSDTNKIFLEKYLNKKLKGINIIPLNPFYLTYKSVNPNNHYKENIFISHNILKNYLSEPAVSTQEYFRENVLSRLKSNHYLCIAFSPVNMDQERFKRIIDSEMLYKDSNLFDLYMFKIRNDLFELSNKHFRLVNSLRKGAWTIYIFKKA